MRHTAGLSMVRQSKYPPLSGISRWSLLSGCGWMYPAAFLSFSFHISMHLRLVSLPHTQTKTHMHRSLSLCVPVGAFPLTCCRERVSPSSCFQIQTEKQCWCSATRLLPAIRPAVPTAYVPNSAAVSLSSLFLLLFYEYWHFLQFNLASLIFSLLK